MSAPLSLFGQLRYEGARFDDDQNTRRIDAGTGVDARLEYVLAAPLRAYLSCSNLFNSGIETGRTAAGVVSYDAPRLITVGLSYRR